MVWVFKEHVRSRIDFLQSGQYEEIFQEPSVMIVYLTTVSDSRRTLMTKWTEELLTELDIKAWAAIFKFGYVEENAIYELGLFTETLWRKPFQNTPVSLFSKRCGGRPLALPLGMHAAQRFSVR